ncbi:MAG: hypothetical protein EXR93_08220 [Gemmatimonadetes bacterium]|nr:hypothetical protein [Gemmatimonadota bacterium]
MIALGMISAATAPLAAQVPGVPGPPSLGITIGVKATTLGLGAEIGKVVGSRLGLRVGINGFTRAQSFNFSDIDYNVSLKLQTVTVLGDLYLLGPLRLSGGLVINKNQGDPLARPNHADHYREPDVPG